MLQVQSLHVILYNKYKGQLKTFFFTKNQNTSMLHALQKKNEKKSGSITYIFIKYNRLKQIIKKQKH